MSAVRLLRSLVNAGLTVAAKGDQLSVRPASGLPDRLRGEVVTYKAELIDLLTGLEEAGVELVDYLHVLEKGEAMDRGEVPKAYTQPVTCSGCGPVWLWPGAPARLIACPWCFRRKAGKRFPQPKEA